MKRIVLAMIVMCCGAVDAEDYLSISGLSYHTQRHQDNGRDWNEVNSGLGLERDLTDSWTLTGGLYRNSLAKTTAFIGGRWEPIRLGSAKLGAMAAAASGYPSPVVGALTASVMFSNRIGVIVLGGPLAHNSGEVVGIYARVRLGN